MNVFKKRLPAMLMTAVIVSAFIIGVMGVWLVSQHKTARLLNIKKEYTGRLALLAEQLQTEVRAAVQKALQSPASIAPGWGSRESVLELIKTMTLNNPLVRYPFMITSTNELLFPLSQKTTLVGASPRTPTPAFSGVAAARRYEKASELEYRDKLYLAAINSYLQALSGEKKAAVGAPIYYAVARCYFKMKSYRQALHYYGLVLAELPGEAGDAGEAPFHATALRQAARAHLHMDEPDNAFYFYSRLYEETLKTAPTGYANLYAFYQNEALDYLGRVMNVSPQKALPGQGKPGGSALPAVRSVTREGSAPEILKRHSALDIAMNWRYFEFQDDPAPGGVRDNAKNGRMMKLLELMDSSDEKTGFYKTLKNSSLWSARPPHPQETIIPLDVPGAGQTCYIAWSILNSGPTGAPREEKALPVIYRGFSISLDYVGRAILPRLTPVEWNTAPLSLEMGQNDDNSLLSVPLSSLFPGAALMLKTAEREILEDIVRGEIQLLYLLLTLLIGMMASAIFLFYKYLSRETQLARLKSEFVDRVSHTLKTPLTRISLLAENIAEGWVNNKEQEKEYMGSIMAETARMSRMIDSMLRFSRAGAGELRYFPEWTSLQRVIATVLKEHSAFLDKHGFTVMLNVDESTPRVWLDAGAAVTIVDNLIQNALKYSPGEKYLGVRLFCSGGYVIFETEDHGLGIPLGDMPRIFDPYARGGDARIKAIEGGGLGLFMVRHGVEAHGGRIEAESGEGGGAAFRVYLPIGESCEPK